MAKQLNDNGPADEHLPPAERPSRRDDRKSAGKPARQGTEVDRYDFQHDSLGYAIRRAQIRAFDLFFDMLGGLDLSPARATALSLVAIEPEINQAGLAKRMNIAGPSALKLVDALEGAGFITREQVVGDRRRYSLVLTAVGHDALEKARVALAAYEARLAGDLSGQERAQLLSLLERVAP